LDLRTWSIRTKLLSLVLGLAFAVGAVSAVFSYASTGKLLLAQIEKRGRYIAENLGANTHFAVLTEDKVSLESFIDSAMLAGDTGREQADVVGILIRDAKGTVLARKGDAPRELPTAPAAAVEHRETVSEKGDPIMLFRAPVTSRNAGGESQELGGNGPFRKRTVRLARN